MDVRKLVLDVLYNAATGYGPKAFAAEAELRARGEHLWAAAARSHREMRVSLYYEMKVVNPNVTDIFATTVA